MHKNPQRQIILGLSQPDTRQTGTQTVMRHKSISGNLPEGPSSTCLPLADLTAAVRNLPGFRS